MTVARTIFDGRTRYARSLKPQVAALMAVTPVPAKFEVGQVVVTPDGKLPIQRRYYLKGGGWMYVFLVRVPGYIPMQQRHYLEDMLLPLQIANVPPPPPRPPLVVVAAPEPDEPDWGAALTAWVRELLGV